MNGIIFNSFSCMVINCIDSAAEVMLGHTRVDLCFATLFAGKICDKPLLQKSPDSVFSGNGDRNNLYAWARISSSGWCASGSGTYLSLDLQKEYHITQVVVMADKEQTKWSSSYLMKYSHDTSYQNSEQVLKI